MKKLGANELPGTTLECLVDELHAELGDVVVEGVGVVTDQFNVGKRVLLRLTVKWRYSAQPASRGK